MFDSPWSPVNTLHKKERGRAPLDDRNFPGGSKMVVSTKRKLLQRRGRPRLQRWLANYQPGVALGVLLNPGGLGLPAIASSTSFFVID
jgi:hypothetical protein